MSCRRSKLLWRTGLQSNEVALSPVCLSVGAATIKDNIILLHSFIHSFIHSVNQSGLWQQLPRGNAITNHEESKTQSYSSAIAIMLMLTIHNFMLMLIHDPAPPHVMLCPCMPVPSSPLRSINPFGRRNATPIPSSSSSSSPMNANTHARDGNPINKSMDGRTNIHSFFGQYLISLVISLSLSPSPSSHSFSPM